MNVAILAWKKLICLRIPFSMWIKGINPIKTVKKCYYNDIYIVAQIMPLAHQSKDIESYDCKDNEVKILRTKYDPANGKFLGIENCVALITVKNDPEEQFFDYGYVKAN